MKLSRRLDRCLQHTKGFYKLADIGTDHAQIPIHAVEKKYVSYALAIDNKIGPFKIAENNVKSRNLQKKITVILGDGLTKSDKDVDVVVISGMGGSLIADILKQADLENVKRLVLQMNNDAEVVRKEITKLGYYIRDEEVIEEKNKFYDLLIFERGKVQYSNLQMAFGPINISKKTPSFTKKIEKELLRLNNLLTEITSPNRQKEIEAEITLLKEALK